MINPALSLIKEGQGKYAEVPACRWFSQKKVSLPKYKPIFASHYNGLAFSGYSGAGRGFQPRHFAKLLLDAKP